MSLHSFSRTVLTLIVTSVLALTQLICLQPERVRAADTIRETSSLKFIPADVAFYGTLLRNREQYDALVNSKAFARLMQMPVVQMAVAKLKSQWEDPDEPDLREFKDFLDEPDNKQLVDFLVDSLSREIFFFGDAGFADLLSVINQISAAQRAAAIEAVTAGQDPGELMAERILQALQKNSGKLNVPTMVIGFKLTDTKRAQAQLARLETLMTQALIEEPKLQKRFRREKIAGSEYLTLRLDGTLIPWEEARREATAIDPAQLDKLIALAKKKTLIISLGVRDDYLLLSIGANNTRLQALGKGKLLIDRTELAPLRKFADKRITSIGYASDEFMKRAGAANVQQIDDLVALAEQALPLAELDEQLGKELIADAKSLAADIKKFIPEPGAMMGFTFLNGSGYEGYTYNWSENLYYDGSKQLSILDHVGGNPIAFYAARGKYSPNGYQFLVKWLKRGYYYFQEFGLDQLGETERENFEKVRKAVEPLLTRLDRATSQMLIPAFKDGQGVFVLDAKLTSKNWHLMMPPSRKPLPMLEMGLVYSVSDAELLKKAFSEYFVVIQETLNKIQEAVPDKVPPIQLPKPQTEKSSSGTIYKYAIPPALGLDQRIAPNAGLSDNVLALSLFPLFTKRLLNKTPLRTSGPLADRNRPLAAAARFNWAGLIEALTPWIDYGCDLAFAFDPLGNGGGADANPTSKAIKDQIHTGLDVLKCFRSYSSVTYVEGKALVTHHQSRYQALE